jgi:syntaxin 1A/syntaxin 1B/2/3
MSSATPQSAPPPQTVKEEPKGKKGAGGSEADDANAIKEFFTELEDIKEKISIVKGSIQDIKSLHDRALNNVISEQENARRFFR